jgi:hypothetical protein
MTSKPVNRCAACLESVFIRLWGIFGFLPFILVSVLDKTAHVTEILYTAIGLQVLIIASSIYRHQYNPSVPPLFILDVSMLICYIVAVLTDKLVFTIPPEFLSPFQCSALMLASLLSMLVCYPFTLQFSTPHVTKEIAQSQGFRTANMLMTSFWLLIFSLMCISSWMGFLEFRRDQRRDDYEFVHTILADVIPPALPLLGLIINPFIVRSIKAASGRSDRTKIGSSVLRRKDSMDSLASEDQDLTHDMLDPLSSHVISVQRIVDDDSGDIFDDDGNVLQDNLLGSHLYASPPRTVQSDSLTNFL